MRTALHVAALAALLVYVSRAAAQQPADGTIVRVDDADFVVDVGDPRVHVGDVLPVYRPVEVRHPVTRQVLRDRFLIGRVRVLQAGPQLSLARVVDAPARALGVGDIVDLPQVVPPMQREPSAPATPVAPGPATPRPVGPQVAAPDPETVAVVALFRATLGRPPEERVSLYGVYLASHPQSPYRQALLEDAATLRGLATRVEHVPGPEELESAERRALVEGTHVDAITGWHPGEVPELAVTTVPRLARSVVLHARAVGAEADAFESKLVPVGADGSARLPLPVGLSRGEGLEYFVEVIGASGVTQWVGAAPGQPFVAHGIPNDAADAAGRSRARFSSELVSFSTKSRDWFLVAEADFLYRVQAGWLYGVRVGFTTYYGQGGTVQELDVLGTPARTAGFSAGYLELELRPIPAFGLIGRIGVGLNRPDESGTQPASIAPGGQLRIRIGEERGVNLQLGGEVIPQLGQRAFVALCWELIRNFPMAAEVQVTNQPVSAGDIGVRAVFELGWRVSPVVQLSLRVSGQGRTIDHVGPGGGFAATFDW